MYYRGFLPEALSCEWAGRRPRRGMDSRLKQARLPWLKTLEHFDYQPLTDKRVVARLAALAFVERVENVVLLGPPDGGKAHLALGVETLEAGHRVTFQALDQLMGRPCRGRDEKRLDHIVAAHVIQRS